VIPRRILNLFRRVREVQAPKHIVDPAFEEISNLLHEIAEERKGKYQQFTLEYRVQHFRAISPERQAKILATYGITMEEFDRSVARRGWDNTVLIYDAASIAAKAAADAVGHGQREKYVDIMEIGIRAAIDAGIIALCDSPVAREAAEK
jgi:hypothetical protein